MQKNLTGVLTGLFFLFLSILCAPFAKGQYQTHYGGQSLVYSASNPNSSFADLVATGDGTLYVLDIGLKEIYSLTPASGGGYTQNVVANSSNGIDLYAYSIDVDASGDVYLSDSATVTAFAPNGSGGYNQHTLVPTGNLGGTTAGVTVDSNGNVYVMAWAGSSPVVYTIYELTPTGGWNFTTKTVLTSASGLLTINGQTLPFAPSGPMRVDKNGVLYFVNGGGELFSETPSGSGWTLGLVLNANSALGTINVQSAPLDVAVDSAANVYALTSLSKGNAVEALNIDGTYFLRTVGSGTEAEGTALTVDENRNLYEVGGFFNEIYEFTSPQQSFADTDLGSTSAVLSFPFTIGSEAEQVTSGKALSMDASGEFTDTGTGTCDTNGPSHHYTVGDTCTVNVIFTPKFAGLRKGVVQVVTTAGVMVSEQYVTGYGVGPQLAFFPPVVSTVGTFSNPTGVAADDNGDLYVLDTGAAKIYLETPSGSSYTQSTLTGVYGNVPLSAGLAIDAAGNLYFNDITDETTWFYQMTGTTVSDSVQAADTSEKVTLSSPNGLAVDGYGNLFIADTGNDRVIESLYYGGDQYGGTSASPWAFIYPEIVPVATGLNSPKAVATDAAGHVLIADTGNNRILIETPTSNHSFTQSVLSTSSLNAPSGVAVDNFNNVYISDSGNKRILEEAAGSGGTYTESVLLSTVVKSPGQLTLDGAGNLYVVDNGSNSVLKIALGTAPTLNFDATAVGQTSADSPQNVTLSNVGNAALNFSVPSSGSNPSISTNFELGSGGSSDCPVISSSAEGPGVLDALSNCILPVSFIPTAVGTITGTLTLTDNAGTSPQVINLNGTGTGAVLATLTSSVSFANTGVGSTSSALYATLTNTGSSTLTLSSIAISGSGASDFNLSTGTNACSATGTVAAGGSCNIYVTFAPAAAQSYSATLTVTDNANPATQTSALSGTGVAPSATLTSTLSFPNTSVGSTSSALYATLTNTGSSTLTLSSIAISGSGSSDFNLSTGTNACSATGTVAAGGSCNIYVTFTPAAVQSYSATLTVTDNANPATQTSALRGTGVAPLATLTSSVSFANTGVGSTSSALYATLTNTGSSTLTLSSIAISGSGSSDFNLSTGTNACSATGTVAAGGSCNIYVAFTPAAAQSYSATLSVTDNANPATQSSALTGTGVAPSATLTSTLSFANTGVGNTSSALIATLSNTGTSALTLSNIAISGSGASDFNLSTGTNACSSTGTVAAGRSCNIYVTFTPAAAQIYSATLSVTDNANPTTQTSALRGTGVAPSATLTSSLSFPNTGVGNTSSALIATLSNTGTSALTLSNIAISGSGASDFNLTTGTNACSATGTVAAGGSCNIYVTFTPAAAQSYSATLTVTDNANPATQTSALSGTGVAPSATLTSTLSFPNTSVGSTSSALYATLTNTGSSTLTLSSIAISGSGASDFNLTTGTNACSATGTVAAGGSCNIYVAFTPAAAQSYSATLSVTDNANPTTQTSALRGTGVAPLATLTSTLSFANTGVGNTSSALIATLSNTGTSALTLSNIAISGSGASDFNLTTGTNACSATGTVAAGGSCNIYVTFTPAAAQSYSATLSVTDNANPTTQTSALSGTGVAPSASLTSSLSFPNTGAGVTSSALIATLSNTGTSTLTLSSIALSGSGASDFNLSTGSNACSATGTVAAGGSCNIYVTFTPAAAQSYSATLSVTDNANPATQSTTLSGTGIQASATLTSSVTFPGTEENTTSTALYATLANTGTAPLTISSLALSGGNYSNFTITTGIGACSTSAQVAAGASCNIYLTFTPNGGGSFSTSLVVTDNASSPSQTSTISGSGLLISASLSASVSFPNTLAGTTSSALYATLTNTGALPINITAITLGGTNPGAFALTTGTNACSTSTPVAVEGSCNIYVTFTPAAAQSYSATLTVTDNAQPSATQTSTLTGTGTQAPDFSITATPATQSVAPGVNASYTVSLAALNGSFGNAVSLSVTGLPAGATATFNPASVVPGSEGASTSTLTIQAVSPLTARNETHSRWPLTVLALLLFVPFNKRWRKSWQVRVMMLIGALVLTASVTGCGGGFAIQPASQSYTLTITGSAPSTVSESTTITHSTTVQLTIQ